MATQDNENCLAEGQAGQHSFSQRPSVPACPACGGVLVEIKQKLQCSQCHTICETCCEGGRG